MFRRQIVGLLSGPLRRVKAGPFELEYERVVSQVRAELPALPPRSPGTTAILVEELAPVARSSPAAAILEAHSRLEHALWELTRGIDIEGASGAIQLARKALDHGLITPEAANAVEGVTTLRNLAAHGRQEDISVNRAIDYLALVDGVLFSLRQRPQESR